MNLFVAFIVGMALLVPALLVAIPVHEMGHAAAAYLQGDRSVRYFGYFNIDPRRFLDPFGVIAVFVALVGWGRKVPIQSNRINTIQQKVLYELGGPAANLLVAFVLGLILQGLVRAGLPFAFELGPGLLGYAIFVIIFLNLSIFAFQLLPVPGLDGWRVIEALFRHRNPRFFFTVSANTQTIWIVCAAVIFLGPYLLHFSVLGAVVGIFYQPASTAILGQCAGYVSLDPCPLSGRF